MQLPETNCSYTQHEVRYTLIVENEGGDVVTQLGPVLRLGSGTVKHAIMSNLKFKGSQTYSLRVQVEMHSQVVTSYRHNFSEIITRTISPFFFIKHLNFGVTIVTKMSNGHALVFYTVLNQVYCIHSNYMQ